MKSLKTSDFSFCTYGYRLDAKCNQNETKPNKTNLINRNEPKPKTENETKPTNRNQQNGIKQNKNSVMTT